MATTRQESWSTETAALPRAERGGDARQPPQRRAAVRKIDPWSVLKFSLIFYFCLLLVVMLGLVVFWAVVTRIGVVEQGLAFLDELQLTVTIDGGLIGRAMFLLGLLNVVLWSGVNVFLAFLYNLIADLIGGIRVTLAEDRVVAE